MTKLISIIVPMFNEEENVNIVVERLADLAEMIAKRWGFSTEVIINDNASTDETFHRIQELQAQTQPRPFTMRVFRFSRNIGFQRSILVGYCKAKGDAVVQIDADMQDPPELILDFIAKWLEGYYVVYGIRRTRTEGRVINSLRRGFYRLIRRISPDELPLDSGDFRLVDRRLVEVVRAVHDQDPYLRGLIASFGTRQLGIPYDRGSRHAGTSKFGLAKLVGLSMDAITNHSALPLRLASLVAFIVVLLIVVLAMGYIAVWLFSGGPLPAGFMTLVLLQLIGVGTLAALLGIQGEYLARIYKQVKDRPLAIIESKLDREQEQEDERKVVTAASWEPRDEIEVLWSGARPPFGGSA